MYNQKNQKKDETVKNYEAFVYAVALMFKIAEISAKTLDKFTPNMMSTRLNAVLNKSQNNTTEITFIKKNEGKRPKIFSRVVIFEKIESYLKGKRNYRKKQNSIRGVFVKCRVESEFGGNVEFQQIYTPPKIRELKKIEENLTQKYQLTYSIN